MKVRWTLREAGHRVQDSWYGIIQIVVASTISYFIARDLFGHPVPLLAVTVTVSSLGFTRDTRPTRVLSTAAAMVFGILVSEVALLLLGQGVWQLALVLLVATVAGRFVSESPAFAITVAIQAVLVQLLPEPIGGVFTRVIDGTLGGLVALTFTALVPRNPIKLAKADAREVFAVFNSTMQNLVSVLNKPDIKIADSTLDLIRSTQPLLDRWLLALQSAAAIAAVSPFYRWAKQDVIDQLSLQHGMDLATRNLRVLTRRVDYLVRDGKPRPVLAQTIERLRLASVLLGQSVSDFSVTQHARKELLKCVRYLTPAAQPETLTLSESAVLLQLRPLWVDLAMAAGVPGDDARAQLPAVD